MADTAWLAAPAGLMELFDGHRTVTQALEALIGDVVVADVREQVVVPARAGNALGVAAGHLVTYRSSVLRGRATGQAYIRGRSLFAPDRLADTVRLRLERSSDPIGRILLDERVRFEKEPLASSEQLVPLQPGERDGPAGDVAWARVYRLLVDDGPAFVVEESFLATMLALL